MKVTADTNILVRAVMQDDIHQSRVATELLRDSELVAVTLPTLCEFVWVLARGYRLKATEIAFAIRRLIDSPIVAVDRPSVEAGLTILAAGGDFADGVIAFEGRKLDGVVFASFDRNAVARLQASGSQVHLLS